MLTEMQHLVGAAHSVVARMQEWRQWMHQHPGVRFSQEETTTLEYITHGVTHDIFPKLQFGGTQIVEGDGGIWIDYTVDPKLPRRLLRADVDALPIQEATGLSFASEHAGVMHACGHDVHSAMLMAAMLAMAECGVTPSRNLRFVFQRAEENPVTPSGGYKLVFEGGVCDGIESAHGLHIWTSEEGTPGVFQARPGGAMANSDRFRVRVRCSGGHVMSPHRGSNAIDIGVHLCNALNGFALRTLGGTEPSSLVPAVFKAGTGSNIRPSDVDMWFANRNVLPMDERMAFAKQLEAFVRAIVALYPDAKVEAIENDKVVDGWEYVYGHPALINTPESVAGVKALLESAGQETKTQGLELGGEDFAWYLQKVPGSFFMLGAKRPESGDHHTPTFNPDPEQFWRGVLYWLLLMTS
ncbi:amidohydrolase [Candidatus Uhrbacteria bacterium]|nr:amidohydrolase [Candidatus Uhrbacteria bacterium]